MSDVVDKVAMALWDAHHCDTSNRRDVSMPEYRDMARAAIAALASHEPDAGPEPASPLPWHVADSIAPLLVLYGWDNQEQRVGRSYCDGDGKARANMGAIAHRVTQWPSLLAANAALRARAEAAEAEVERLKAEVKLVHDNWDDDNIELTDVYKAELEELRKVARAALLRYIPGGRDCPCCGAFEDHLEGCAWAALSPETKAKLDGGDR